MSGPAIRVEGLGKHYRLGEHHSFGSLRETLVNRLRTLGRRPPTGEAPSIWALREVSFEVAQGEAIGIIGRNGAGKSTLLKVLSRITEPTTGRAEIRGRVGSLLEVGTGFHPELTGRENIYLNGAILGMKRHEIRQRFDDIVSFAEVERFIDTPVKRYSSGMYLRLAFAVAAHLEPEILLVDEVLAVGDSAFQKKCLGKMSEVAQKGRTVVFVSHNMAAVSRLCERVILLDAGRLVSDGEAAGVTGQYLRSDSGTAAERRWNDPDSAPGDEVSRLLAVKVICNGEVSENVDIRRPVTIEMEFVNKKEGSSLLAAFSFFDEHGTHLFVSPDFDDRTWGPNPRPAGVFRTRCTVPGNFFAEGLIKVAAEVATREPSYILHFIEHDCVAFQVVDTGRPGSVRGSWSRNMPGVIRPLLDWSTELLGAQDTGERP